MRNSDAAGGRVPLVIGCGGLANELVELTRRAGVPAMDLTCLPASLHNRPERIPAAVQARIRRARREGYERIFVAYADCGTGGLLDRMLDSEPEAAGVARLDGAHCYEVYAGLAAFAALHDEEPGTFYLTDYLARNFERLVVQGLGLDRHPELLPLYFGNYRRLVFLAQVDDPALTDRARAAADRLGLEFERRLVGLGELAGSVATFGRAAVERPPFHTSKIDRAEAAPAPVGRQLDRRRTQTGNETARGASGRALRRSMERPAIQQAARAVERAAEPVVVRAAARTVERAAARAAERGGSRAPRSEVAA